MKRLSLITAISAALVLPGLVQAADSTASATLGLSADVQGTCFMGSGGTSATTFDTATLSLTNDVSTTTALLTTNAHANQKITKAYCNTASTLAMTSTNGGLKAADVSTITAGTFAGDNTTSGTSILHYHTSASTWAGVALTAELATASDTDGALAPTGAVNGDFTTTVTLDSQSTNPVLKGHYADIITVTISATI